MLSTKFTGRITVVPFGLHVHFMWTGGPLLPSTAKKRTVFSDRVRLFVITDNHDNSESFGRIWINF